MTASTKQLITGLYVAFYNRAPDKAGLTHWEQRASAGNEATVLSEIAADFAAHAKFSELYGHLDNQQFVEAIYRNVLGHAGDNAGISYWTGKIESVTQRSDMVVNFIHSALNFDASDEEWNTLTAAEKAIAQNRHDTLVNKTTAAIAFVDTYGDATNISSPADLDNDPAYLASIVALSNIDETPASIDVAAARLSLPGDVIVIDASTEADTTTDTTAPFFITSSTARAIDENSGAGQVIYKAHAEDTGTITYRLKPGDDSALLSIDGVTGKVSLRANPDYEGKSGYSFTVIATDENANSSEKAVSLAINNLTDTTPLPSADTTAPTATLLYSTDGGSTYSTTLIAKDADTLRIKATFNEAINDGPGATIAIDNSVLTATAMVKTTTTEYYYDLDVPAGDIATATVTIGAAEDNANNVITTAPTNATFSIDNTPPTTTLTGASYDAATDTLTFTGTAMNTLLSGAEDATTDLKANFDWTKLQWDVDSDDTGNTTFSESDIASAKATDATTLAIALGAQKATALETATGFDPLNSNDQVEVGAGFTRDVAGNAATTDKFIGPTDTTVVVFDLVGGTSSGHSGRTFDAGTAYTIYIRVDSNSAALAVNETSGHGTWGAWSGANALGADDQIVLVGTGTQVLGMLRHTVNAHDTFFGVQATWRSPSATAATLSKQGFFARHNSFATSNTILWSGGWASNPNAGHTLGQIYAVGIPANILTSQGLA